MNLKTYALYCAELPLRAEALDAHLRERNVRAVLWRGLHGRTWRIRTDAEYAPGHHLPPGHVGLNIGSWFLHQHIWHANPDDRPDAAYLILEDDAKLPVDFWGQLDAVDRELRAALPDWDLVFLGMAEREPKVWHKVTERVGPPDGRLCRLAEPFGTHAYLLRRRALPVMLDHMAAAERNLDQQLWARVLRPGLLRWCAVLPSVVEQRTFDYTGDGKVEWEPSCVHPSDNEPPPARTGPAEILQAAAPPAEEKKPEPPPTERPTAEVIETTTALVDPYPCMYRGEPLDEVGVGAGGRTAPLDQCARYVVPCHSKPGTFRRDGDEVRACARCPARTEMSAHAPRPRLPIPVGHFNPSIALWEGRLILATRDSWGHSRVALWELTNARPDWTGEWAARALGSFASAHPEATRLEDPRLFAAPNPDTGRVHLHAMFNLPDGYPARKVQVGYARFARDLSGIEHTTVFPSPNHNKYEKNWVPFYCPPEDDTFWVYGTKPQHTVLGRTCWSTDNPLPWSGGVARGAPPPVLVSPGDFPHAETRDVYYHFFHGCLKRVQGAVYTVGCAVFDGRPPFQVMRQTPTPILWPDLPGASEETVKRYVVWPGGAVLHAGAWFIALGIDDTYSRIVRIPVAEVEGALSDRPGGDAPHTLRATRIATGLPEE